MPMVPPPSPPPTNQHPPLGWSDLQYYRFAVDLVYSYESNSKKSANFAELAQNIRAEVLIVTKSQEPKFLNFFILNSLSMNTRLKENWKLNFIYHFILGPKMGKMVFDLDKGNFFFGFYKFFA